MTLQSVKNYIRDSLNVSKGRARFTTIRDRIMAAAKIDAIHLCQLISAMLIASIGLNINSTEAVVGAMLICPLMGTVVAIAYSVAIMDMRLLRRFLFDMVQQCGICLITSTLYFLLTPLHVETSELLTNSQATVWDMVTALVGGFAGALGISRRQEPATLLSGVAVATALMPPLCATGYGFAVADLSMAASALYEFMINVVFIGAGATLVFAWLHVPFIGDIDGDGKISPAERAEAQRGAGRLRNHLVLALSLFAIPCLYFSMQMVQKASENNDKIVAALDQYDTQEVTEELGVLCPKLVSYTVSEEDWYNRYSRSLEERLVATVMTSEEMSEEQKRQAEGIIRIHVDDVAQVRFKVSGS